MFPLHVMTVTRFNISCVKMEFWQGGDIRGKSGLSKML